MQVNYQGKRISSIKIDVKGSDIKKKEYADRYQNMMKHLTNIFMEMQLNNAQAVIDYAKNYGIELKPLLVPHSKGLAMCSGSYYSNKISMKPYINFDCHDFFIGWTFTRGCFADVDIHFKDNYVLIITKDCHANHEVFLLWLAERLERYFYDENYIVPTYTGTMNINNKIRVQVNSNEYETEFQVLNPVVEQLVNRNKSKRIDTIKANGITIKDYIVKNCISKVCPSNDEMFDLMLSFGKPFKQVSSFLSKL